MPHGSDTGIRRFGDLDVHQARQRAVTPQWVYQKSRLIDVVNVVEFDGNTGVCQLMINGLDVIADDGGQL